ncbi:restriction endonuclease subunit S [Candidatus Haliotispira prima]|uniref:Restriction endonuclease subunit S n=1 Tax=Candidatus Haliotispira prima TaxID=3034016 RepID=A0ABY8MLT8_9SPIO|nr:restriction endonuclease subunit S [Candidatus Haliotispira prima]
MSKMDDLLNLAGNQVQYLPMGEVGTFIRGNGLQKKDFTESGVGCIHYGQIYTYYGTYANKTKTFVSKELASSLKQVKTGDIVIAVTSENIEDICKCVAWLGLETIVTGGHAIIFKHNENPKYIAYYLQTHAFFNQKKLYARGAKVIDISKKDIEKILIPIPPLPIQEEIVKILDTFARLEAKLEAELKADLETHQQLYSHCRDKLLSFDKNQVEYLPMGEVGTFIRGNGLQKKDFTESGVGCIHYGQIYTYYKTHANETKTFIWESLAKKLRKANTGDLVIATTSENDEDVCKAVTWLGEKEIAVSGDAYIYKHSLNPKYVSYFFQTDEFQKQKRPYITGTKVRRVSGDSISKIKIPIPSPEEQERIVTTIDTFDALVNNISGSLLAETKARRQQYEYYRNKLLTFKETI